eukprot:15365357-Ditylum_brightwellii.AAC.1
MIENVKPFTISEHQKYEKCSDAFKCKEHYVGMSEAIKSVQNTYVKTITPTKVDKVLKFQATLGNGTQEMDSDEWLKENFCTLYNYFTRICMMKKILKEWYTAGRDLVKDHIAEHDNWDGLFTNMVELTELSLDKMCGHVDKEESPTFDGILAGYEVIPPGVVKEHIKNIGLWCEPKEKAYFRKVLRMKNWM